jgi:hypothetical protein
VADWKRVEIVGKRDSRRRVASVGIVRKRVGEDGRVTVGADREGIVGVCVCVMSEFDRSGVGLSDVDRARQARRDLSGLVGFG